MPGDGAVAGRKGYEDLVVTEGYNNPGHLRGGGGAGGGI